MATDKVNGTHHGRYVGPPGDSTTYWMPRDRAPWEASWDRHMGSTVVAERVAGEDHPGERHEVDMSPEAVAERARIKARAAEAMSYISSYTGTFGLILDLRADRRWGTKHMRLSERQAEAVLASRDRDLARLEAARLNTEPTQPTVVSDGWYVVDDVPWKVQWNREHTGRYAKRLRIEDGEGVWEYVPGGLSIVARGRVMTRVEASAFGKLYGVCAICGRRLTDEKSIAQGIGPVCITKLEA